jgi:hypothetical protein
MEGSEGILVLLFPFDGPLCDEDLPDDLGPFIVRDGMGNGGGWKCRR